MLKVNGKLDIEQAALPQQAAAPQQMAPVADVTGGLKLPATGARLHGSKVKLESKNNNIGFWREAGDWVEWQFNLAQAGRYAVIVDYASKSDSSFEILAGNQKLRATVTTTGDHGKFRMASLGSIELPAGQTSLAVKPIKEAWKPINLRSVVLMPAK